MLKEQVKKPPAIDKTKAENTQSIKCRDRHRVKARSPHTVDRPNNEIIRSINGREKDRGIKDATACN